MLWQLANSVIVALLMFFCILFWFNSKRVERGRQELEQQCQELKLELEQFKQESMSASVHNQQSLVNLKKQQQEVLQHLEQAIGFYLCYCKPDFRVCPRIRANQRPSESIAIRIK